MIENLLLKHGSRYGKLSVHDGLFIALQKTAKGLKTNDKLLKEEDAFLKRLYTLLESGKSARQMEVETENETLFLSNLNLLTTKPILYAANVSEEDVASGEENELVKRVKCH